MTKTMKAVLLSAVIFPGAGHFYLKKMVTGIVLSSVTSIASYFILMNIFNRIVKVFEKIQSGEMEPEFVQMILFVLSQPEDPQGRISLMVWLVLLMSWLLAIGDCYRIARKKSSVL